MCFVGTVKRTILCAALMLTLAACGSTARSPAAAPAHPAQPVAAASPAPGAAACARLGASAFPPATYDNLVISQIDLITGNGDASKADIRAAKATVAGWVRNSCPQFAYLTRR
jgi:hypothetical protein